jgi:Tfp pilus assembly protein PilX
MTTIKSKSGGFASLIAIVLIVMLGLFGITFFTFTTSSIINTANAKISSQTMYAARSALQWAVYTALDNGSTCDCSNISGETINYSTGSLDGYEAEFPPGTDGCKVSAETEKGKNYCVYNLSVIGKSASSPGDYTYASRQFKISITNRDAP